ncbi:peptidoglycan-binding LysM domain-containing protein [Trifolium repens]|nr:peptidoglycan-binding LysM domain-containing protein [Trifolium repens]
MNEMAYKMTLKSLLFIMKLLAILLLIVNIVRCYFPIIHGDVLETHESIDVKNRSLKKKPCDDFYKVKEGETYYSIVEKCKDPHLLLKNPHIQDPDDIYPGVILLLADIEVIINGGQLKTDDSVNVENLNPHDISFGDIFRFSDNIKMRHSSIKIADQPCGEFYIVGKGETFYSITEKCNDPFILEMNPHIQEPDDIFSGVTLRLRPH